jgi:hypothetical protein
MLIPIAIIVAVALAVLLAYAATRPNTFRIQRSATINIDAERIFGFINDFQRWPLWSPFEKLDPAMKKSYSGPPTGPGAACAWDGNSKAGSGRMEIMSIVPASKAVVKLEFFRPFKARNTAEFTLVPAAAQSTRVTWAMYGPRNFILKLMSIFVNMDKMIGKDFEEGLNNLKAQAERQSKTAIEKV